MTALILDQTDATRSDGTDGLQRRSAKPFVKLTFVQSAVTPFGVRTRSRPAELSSSSNHNPRQVLPEALEAEGYLTPNPTLYTMNRNP